MVKYRVYVDSVELKIGYNYVIHTVNDNTIYGRLTHIGAETLQLDSSRKFVSRQNVIQLKNIRYIEEYTL